jgi:sugar lactone lactonase YvrE
MGLFDHSRGRPGTNGKKAKIHESSAIPGAVKILQFDLATGDCLRAIYLDPVDAHPGTRLAHMRFHGDHAIVAESKEGSFYVIDLRDNSYRRILAGHPLMRCIADDVPTVEGRKVHLPTGKPLYVHNDLLEFGVDPDILFFMPLFSSRMYQIDVNVLKNPSLTDDEIAAHVSVAHEFGPWITGICRDNAGNIYLSDAENGAIRVLRPNGRVEMIVKNDKMIWPNTISVGPDGYIYFTSTQLNRVPRFSGGADLVERPWRMFKAKLPG